MKNFFGKYKYLIFTLIASLAVYFRWLSFSIFFYSDYGFQFSDSLRGIPSFDTWSSYGLGGINLLLWRLAGQGNLLYGLFGFGGFDSNIADKFLVMWPWVILSGVASFFLVRKITLSDIGGLIGAFVFSFNTYFLAIDRAGHLLLSISSVWAVFSLLFYIKTLEEKKIYLAILTALFLFITASYDFRNLYIVFWVLFFYALYFLIVINKISDYRKTFKNILVISLPIIIFSLLSVFWVAASFRMGSLVENAALERPLFGSSFFNITRSITSLHPFWTGGKIDWFIVQEIPFYFWLTPILAFLGLILNKKNKNIVFFGVVALIGIFLSKQVAEPFGSIYKWLFENFPGLNAFREASKFYFLIALGYSVLIGAFVSWLWKNWNKRKWKIYGKYFLIFLISFIFLWNTKPIITGEIGSMFIPRHIPVDYLILKDFILKQDGSFRTFWTPGSSRWAIYTNEKRIINNVNVVGYEWKNYASLKPGHINLPVNKRITEIFKTESANELFDISSIKYIVIPIRDKANDDDFFISYGNDRNFYIDQISKIRWLKKIDIGTNELVVYENEDYRPHIYQTLEKETITKNIPYSNMDYSFINPTEYKVKLKNVSTPVFINFSESFHKDWKARAGGFNWVKVLTEKNYFIPDNNHFKNDAQLNSFSLDPTSICKSYECKKNPDGTYDINLTLYFAPQSYFYLGLIISGTTLLFCLSYLCFSFWKRRRGDRSGEEKEGIIIKKLVIK